MVTTLPMLFVMASTPSQGTVHVTGTAAQELIAALTNAGATMAHAKGTPEATLSVAQLTCSGWTAQGLDVSEPAAFLAKEQCRAGQDRLGEAHWLFSALANAGIQADVGMGSYETQLASVRCFIALKVTVAEQRFSCDLEQ
jgi:hypothetical protein